MKTTTRSKGASHPSGTPTKGARRSGALQKPGRPSDESASRGTPEEATTRDKAAGISDDAVRARTGKGWDEWFTLLDRAGAREWNHTAIAAHLYTKLKCPGWWNQMVAVGYEQARGLREKHQTSDGYSVSCTRTYAAPVVRLFEQWTNVSLRSRWLEHKEMAVSKAAPGKSIRISWTGGESRVEVYLHTKGRGKSQVNVEHSRLPNQREALRMKAWWGQQLDRLRNVVEG